MALMYIENVEDDDMADLDLALEEELDSLPTPTGSRVIVEIAREQEMVGSLFLPESTRRHRKGHYFGIVLRVGQGKRLDDNTLKPMEVSPGDAVMWMYPAGHDGNSYNKPYADGNLSIGDRKMVIIEEDDIFAKVEA